MPTTSTMIGPTSTTRAPTTTTTSSTTSPSSTSTTQLVPTTLTTIATTTTVRPTTTSTSPVTATTTSVAPTSTSTSSSTSSTTTSTLAVATGTTLSPVRSVTVSPNPVPAGQDAVVTGTGFPLGPTDLTLFSTPAFLGRVIVGLGGTFSRVVTIPADTPPGPHRLVVTGILGNVLAEAAVVVTAPTGAPAVTPVPSPTVTVRATGGNPTQGVPAGVQLVRTGTDVAAPIWLALTVAGLGLLMVRTRQTGPWPAGRRRRSPWG